MDYKIPTEATTEKVDQASAEQEKQPEMPEDLPVDSEDDIPDSDTDNISDNMEVDEPPEAGSMRGEAQTHDVNAPGETSVGRQRELAAGLSDDSAQKRQRIQLLEDLAKIRQEHNERHICTRRECRQRLVQQGDAEEDHRRP